MLGTSPIDVEVGSSYTDAGATAQDNYDGSLTGSIVTVSTVNTSVLGTYTVTYNVSDSSGNAATQVMRTVRVVDTTPPVITLNGDAEVTLEWGVEGYTELGATVTDVGDPGVTSVVVGGDTVDPSTRGTYHVTYSATDSSGNTRQVIRTVNVELLRFMWGDLDANDLPGAMDAGLLLQYDVFLIDRFPGYPFITFPDFHPAADVNTDGVAGALDAGLILQHYVFMIESFPSDLDQDGYGPDSGPGKVSRKIAAAGRKLSVSVTSIPQQDVSRSWRLSFSIDDGNNVQGLRLALRYNPEEVSARSDEVEWLVPDPGKELVVNAQQKGLLVISGALREPLLAGPRDLMAVRLRGQSSTGGQGPIVVQLDKWLTRVNDGNIPIDAEGALEINLPADTSVHDWTVY
jgi:hypothetical protein